MKKTKFIVKENFKSKNNSEKKEFFKKNIIKALIGEYFKAKNL